jgi:hypothetical protein
LVRVLQPGTSKHNRATWIILLLNLQKSNIDASSPRAAPLPFQLTDITDPVVRELALAAQRYGRAGQRDPGDFEAIYNHGLALQELALRSNSSRPHQELLLRQVRQALLLLCQVFQNANANSPIWHPSALWTSARPKEVCSKPDP